MLITRSVGPPTCIRSNMRAVGLAEHVEVVRRVGEEHRIARAPGGEGREVRRVGVAQGFACARAPPSTRASLRAKGQCALIVAGSGRSTKSSRRSGSLCAASRSCLVVNGRRRRSSTRADALAGRRRPRRRRAGSGARTGRAPRARNAPGCGSPAPSARGPGAAPAAPMPGRRAPLALLPIAAVGTAVGCAPGPPGGGSRRRSARRFADRGHRTRPRGPLHGARLRFRWAQLKGQDCVEPHPVPIQVAWRQARGDLGRWTRPVFGSGARHGPRLTLLP